jgi:hypothetical protein
LTIRRVWFAVLDDVKKMGKLARGGGSWYGAPIGKEREPMPSKKFKAFGSFDNFKDTTTIH